MVKISGGIHFDKLTDDEAAVLSRHGDTEALTHLWDASIGQANRIAGLFVRRYPWINHADLTQDILVEFPKLVRRFNPDRARARGISWNKYAYFAFYRAAQDALRREDPLGISIPQKAKYPSWRLLSEVSDSPNLTQAIVLDGLNKLDRGDVAVLEGPSEINSWPQAEQQAARKSAEYHDFVYHGSKTWAKAESQ